MKELFSKADAQYTPEIHQQFKGNPYIEAMDSLPEEDQNIEDLLSVNLQISDDELKLSKQERMFLPEIIYDIYVPGRQLVSLAKRCISYTKNGYRKRNPFVENGAGLFINSFNSPCGPSCQAGKIATVVGPSGIGKTTAVARVLCGLGSQVIFHKEYNTRCFNEIQLLYHYVNITGSLKPEDVYVAVGKKAGELTENRLAFPVPGRNRSPDFKRDYCERVLKGSATGVLVIDNFERILKASETVREEMLAMLVNIRDSFGMPILLVGTMEVANYLQRDTSVTSRLVEGGYWEMKRPLSWVDEEWNEILEVMWSYSWARNQGKLDDTVKMKIYDCTQGITRLLATLLVESQKLAIEREIEEITIEILDEVFNTHLKMMHPVLEALATKDPTIMRNYEAMYAASAQQLPGQSQANAESEIQGLISSKKLQAKRNTQ